MKILIESTPTMTTVDGTPVRLWEGVTDGGVRCKVFVRLIAVHLSQSQEAFERELRETAAPGELATGSPHVISLRHIL